MIKNDLTQESLVATVSETDNNCPNGEAEGSYAFMKEGRLVVRHPPEGPYPLVMPCPGVRLIVNGKERTKLIPVSLQDAVSVEAVDERKEGDWSISVSADGLQAKLRVRPTVVLCRELADLPPASKLQLAVIEVEEFLPPLTWDELLEELSRQGINYGVDWQACSRGVALCTEEEVVVARGTVILQNL